MRGHVGGEVLEGAGSLVPGGPDRRSGHRSSPSRAGLLASPMETTAPPSEGVPGPSRAGPRQGPATPGRRGEPGQTLSQAGRGVCVVPICAGHLSWPSRSPGQASARCSGRGGGLRGLASSSPARTAALCAHWTLPFSKCFNQGDLLSRCGGRGGQAAASAPSAGPRRVRAPWLSGTCTPVEVAELRWLVTFVTAGRACASGFARPRPSTRSRPSPLRLRRPVAAGQPGRAVLGPEVQSRGPVEWGVLRAPA